MGALAIFTNGSEGRMALTLETIEKVDGLLPRK